MKTYNEKQRKFGIVVFISNNEVEKKLSDIIKSSIDLNGGIWGTCTMNKIESQLMNILGL